ncbi:hypothetical protein FOZ63_004081, partial [Perkinsus olseni]
KLQLWLAAAPSRWMQHGLRHIAERLNESYSLMPDSLTRCTSDDLADQLRDGSETLPPRARALSFARLLSTARELSMSALRRFTSSWRRNDGTEDDACLQLLRNVNPRTLKFNNPATESSYVMHSQAEAVKQGKLCIKVMVLPLCSWGIIKELTKSKLISAPIVFVLLIGCVSYWLTTTRFFRRHYNMIMTGMASFSAVAFHVRRMFTGVDDAHIITWIPFFINVVIRIPFPRALTLSLIHLTLFILNHLARRLEMQHDSTEARDCGVDFNSFCKLLDYLPMMTGITVLSVALGYRTELNQRSCYLISFNSRISKFRSREVLHNMLPSFVSDSIIESNQDSATQTGRDSRSLVAVGSGRLLDMSISKPTSALEIGTFARRCGNVTVLFCDVADFPQLAAALAPKQLISMMHRLFSSIDKLVFIHALTKLETVSESYVVCSGLNPEDNSDDRFVSTDAFRAVILGLDILDKTANMNVSVDSGSEAAGWNASITLIMKIGIHTGPVISGVVGSKRPQFCIFGDTINTASRMKSTAIPNRVHLSSSTRECLEFSSSLSFEERETFIKGKGMLVTYDASRTFGSPHTKDAGLMSPRALRTRHSTTSLDISNLDKPRRVEPFKRTSQT